MVARGYVQVHEKEGFCSYGIYALIDGDGELEFVYRLKRGRRGRSEKSGRGSLIQHSPAKKIQ